MRKVIAVLSMCTFFFILDFFKDDAPRWCGDSKIEWQTNLRTDSHRKAARLAKTLFCKVMEDESLLYHVNEVKAMSYDSSKICAASRSLNSNKDEGSKLAAKAARDRLCGRVEKVRPFVKPDPKAQTGYFLNGRSIKRPIRERVR